MTANTNWKKFPPKSTQALFVAVEEMTWSRRISACRSRRSIWNAPREHPGQLRAVPCSFGKTVFFRRELLQLVNGFLQDLQLAAATCMRYKYIRARYKHLRFAQQLYGAPHRANRLFHTTTVVLGHFQDAFLQRQPEEPDVYGNLLRLLLSKTGMVLRALCAPRHTRLESAQAYRLPPGADAPAADAGSSSGADRASVPRRAQSSAARCRFYDTLRSIDPDNCEARQISRFPRRLTA